ncbi:MAG: MFS transporter, partial [Nanoarchaeota archaeon]
MKSKKRRTKKSRKILKKNKRRILKYSHEKDSPRIKKKKYQARFLSIKDGIFNSIKMGFGERYIAPFAIAINTSNSVVAMLSSFAGLFGPISQLFGSRVMNKFSRKDILRKAVFYESLIWLPLIAIASLFYFGLLRELLPVFLILFFVIYMSLVNFPIPAWFSWMGDIVGNKYRGRWFSKRNFMIGFNLIIFTIISALFLDFMKKQNNEILGFIVLFFIAFISRFYCWKILKDMYEPNLKRKPFKKKRLGNFGIVNFLISAHKNNFGKFALFRFALSFSTSIAAPFFAIYLLRYLGFNYFIYMVITLAATVFSLFVIDLWGLLADKFGNYEVMSLTAGLIPWIPLLWMISPNWLYLAIVPGFIAGVAWAGFNLASGNFLYDNLNIENRGEMVSYYNVLNGLGIFFGAGFGALLIRFVSLDFIEPLFFIFIISTIARFLVITIILSKIKEVRKTQKIDSKILKKTIFKYARPTLVEEAHEIV